MLYALRQAEAWGAEELFVKADSKLIVNQVNGEWAPVLTKRLTIQ